MNKKAQAQMGIGVFLVAFVAVVVGIVLFQAVSQFVGGSTNTADYSARAQAVPTETITLTGQDLIGSAVVVNQSGNINCANNYTISDGVSSTTGTKRVLMRVGPGDKSLCTALNYTSSSGPEG